MPAAFNVLFEGVTPQNAREVSAKAILSAQPKIVYEPAAGRFGSSETIVKLGLPSDRLFASDISLFSSLIGYLADPARSIADLGLRWSDVGQAFLEGADPDDEVAIAAAAMVGVKWDQLKPRHQYNVNLRRELWHNRQKYRERLRSELTELLEGLGPVHYEIADLRQVFADHKDDPEVAIYCNPPGYSARAYERMFDTSVVEFGAAWVPDSPWDKVALAKLYAEVTDCAATVVMYSINAEHLPEGWTKLLAIQRTEARTDFVVANKPIGGDRHTLVIHTQRAAGKPIQFEVYDDQEITAESVLEFVEIDRPTALYYRDLFVHRLGTTQSEWYIAMTIDGRLVTVLGLNRQKLMQFKDDYVRETFGISVTSKRYKRLGRLFMLAITTRAFWVWMRAHGRYGIREAAGIMTTSLTKNPESKIDRSMMECVAREQLPNGVWKLVYKTDFRDESFADALRDWLGQASQSGESTQGPQGRRRRRKEAVAADA